jgi:hypothetical protein
MMAGRPEILIGGRFSKDSVFMERISFRKNENDGRIYPSFLFCKDILERDAVCRQLPARAKQKSLISQSFSCTQDGS